MKDIPPVDFAKLKIVKWERIRILKDHPGENQYNTKVLRC